MRNDHLRRHGNQQAEGGGARRAVSTRKYRGSASKNTSSETHASREVSRQRYWFAVHAHNTDAFTNAYHPQQKMAPAVYGIAQEQNQKVRHLPTLSNTCIHANMCEGDQPSPPVKIFRGGGERTDRSFARHEPQPASPPLQDSPQKPTTRTHKSCLRSSAPR